MFLDGQQVSRTRRRPTSMGHKAAVIAVSCGLVLSASSAEADSSHRKPTPKPTASSSVKKKAVSSYLANRNQSVAATRARRVGYLRRHIAHTRLAIANARVDGVKVIKIAARYKGTPYRSGGTTPKGFDCSGYTQFVFHQVGISLPRVAQDQYRWTKRISAKEAKPGDLAFYMSGKYSYHAAIYAGNGYIWHSPHTGATVSKVKIGHHKMAYGRIPASAVASGLRGQLAHDIALLNQLIGTKSHKKHK